MTFIHDGSETVRDHCYLFTVRDHSVLVCYVVIYIILWLSSFTVYTLREGPWMICVHETPPPPLRLPWPEARPLSPAPGCCRSRKAPRARHWAYPGRDFPRCGTACKPEGPARRRSRRRSRPPSRARWWRTTAGKELKTETERKQDLIVDCFCKRTDTGGSFQKSYVNISLQTPSNSRQVLVNVWPIRMENATLLQYNSHVLSVSFWGCCIVSYTPWQQLSEKFSWLVQTFLVSELLEAHNNEYFMTPTLEWITALNLCL